MKRFLLLLALLPVALHAQKLNLLESNLHMEGDRLEMGIVICERELDVWSYVGYHDDPDSAEVHLSLADSRTGERLPWFAVFAVHREGGNIVSDSLVWSNGEDELAPLCHFRIDARRPRLLVVATAGYRPALLEYEPVKDPEIQKSTKREFERQKPFVQTFDTLPMDTALRHRIVDYQLDELERSWYDSGELSLHLGRFLPSGTMVVRVDAPIDDFRRFLFDTHYYSSRSLHADYAYALSPDGYLVGQVIDGNLRVTWEIARLDGFEWHELWPISFHLPGPVADEFRWGTDGWLFFRSGNQYFKLHVDIPTTQNCRMKDVEISREEFEQAKAESSKYNTFSSGRTADAADTAILRTWVGERGYLLYDFLEESGAASFGDLHCLEIAIGDYCVTRLKADTVDMATCFLTLSPDGLFAGIEFEDLVGDDGVPAFIYIYPLAPDGQHVGSPSIYQTTPAWKAATPYFWGSDGWLFVEGFDPNNNTVYHKLHL